jgi:hypothetical protein
LKEWHAAVSAVAKRTQIIVAVADRSKPEHWGWLHETGPGTVVWCNASGMRDWTMASTAVGKKRHFASLEETSDRFMASKALDGVEIQWGSGVEDVYRGWLDLCEEKVKGDIGLVYEGSSEIYSAGIIARGDQTVSQCGSRICIEW